MAIDRAGVRGGWARPLSSYGKKHSSGPRMVGKSLTGMREAGDREGPGERDERRDRQEEEGTDLLC